jgi:formylmethanofuran dehydrogenase subunit E
MVFISQTASAFRHGSACDLIDGNTTHCGFPMESFEQLLDESTRIHGHICAGQVIGVRMAMAALERIGISDPKGADRKKLYVLVEIDRCATDAIQSVTGCSLGKRSLRWLDFGIMAATFVNLETSRAVRAIAREEARTLSEGYCPEIVDKYQRQLEAYKVMPLAELFDFQEVTVQIPACDMPGRPIRRVQCSQCGDWVQDCREQERDGKLRCRACDGGRYYQVLSAATQG